jgi:integrase
VGLRRTEGLLKLGEVGQVYVPVVIEVSHGARGRRDGDPPKLAAKNHAVEMLRADLQAARAKWLDDAKTEAERNEREKSPFLSYYGEDGRVADFHALRHTFITNLVRGGVHPKVAQTLARHSTITLTMDRYSHTVVGEQVAALDALPVPAPLPARSQPPDATGTDG